MTRKGSQVQILHGPPVDSQVSGRFRAFSGRPPARTVHRLSTNGTLLVDGEQGASIVASVRKWGNGYQVRYRGPDGKQRARSFDKRRDANGFAATVEVEKNAGTWIAPEGGRILVREWAKEWEATLVGVRTTTRERDLSMLRNHVLIRFGDLPLSKVEHIAVVAGRGPL